MPLEHPESDSLARAAVTRVPKLPQAQYDLTQQLYELAIAADRLGLYDAADFLRREIDTGAARLIELP